jgi:hypothetical protein
MTPTSYHRAADDGKNSCGEPICNSPDLNANVSSSGFSICTCNEGYYLDKSSKSCIECPSYGFKCEGGDSDYELCSIGSHCSEGVETECEDEQCPYPGMFELSKSFEGYASICLEIKKQSLDFDILALEKCEEERDSDDWGCEKDQYRDNGICTACKSGYLCPGGGNWNSEEHYFEDNLPTLCPPGQYCDYDEDDSITPPPTECSQEMNCSHEIPGMFTDPGRNQTSPVCCEDDSKKIPFSGDDPCEVPSYCPVHCPSGQYADAQARCQGRLRPIVYFVQITRVQTTAVYFSLSSRLSLPFWRKQIDHMVPKKLFLCEGKSSTLLRQGLIGVQCKECWCYCI